MKNVGEYLKGKVVVVTGSGRGIGRAIAIGMAAEGAKVVTNSRKPGSTGTALLSERHLAALSPEDRARVEQELEALTGDAETTAEAIRKAGGEAVAFFGDISDFKVAGELIKTAVDTFGGVDVLVNVAGTFGFSPIWELSEELWDKVTRVKPKGYFNTIRHAVPYMMEKRWGRILNCTSRAFFGDTLRHAEYCAANAGVVGLTRAVAIELFPYGITCNAFSPWAYTRASVELEAHELAASPEERAWVDEGFNFPASITPGPEYVVPFLVFLASDAAADVSGSIFEMGGNRIALYSEPKTAHTMYKQDPAPWTVDEIVQHARMGILAGYQTSVAVKPPRSSGESS
ncbi:MAG: SDR family oxidoreductase [Thermoleophilia bacterium]|nr:SDR family oxidoreductase [Thermoleophilia bacterium]